MLRTPRMELTTELAGALVNWHDSSPDAHLHHELWAYAAVPSVASQRVLSKVGFEFVGYRDHHATVCRSRARRSAALHWTMTQPPTC